jgi:hypothetical protein
MAATVLLRSLQVLRHGPEHARQVSPCSYMRLDVPLDCTGPLRLLVRCRCCLCCYLMQLWLMVLNCAACMQDP